MIQDQTLQSHLQPHLSPSSQLQPQHSNSQSLQQQFLNLNLNLDPFPETNSEDEAYNQLQTKWAMRQKQSYNDLTGQRQTIYLYDPNSTDFSVYQKPVSEERTDIFRKYTVEIWRYLSAKFIVEEIIEPIQNYRLLDQEVLENVQFLAWTEMCTIMKSFNKNKSHSNSLHQQIRNSNPNPHHSLPPINKPPKTAHKQPQKIQFIFSTQDINLKYLLDPMLKFSKKIQQIFTHYHQILTQRQNYFKYKLKAWADFLFHRKQKVNQDKFMCGFEGVDFSRDEQIGFMGEFYQGKVRKLLVGSPCGYSQSLVARLAVMRELLVAKVDKMEGYDDFDRIKKEMMDKWKLQHQVQHQAEEKKCQI